MILEKSSQKIIMHTKRPFIFSYSFVSFSMAGRLFISDKQKRLPKEPLRKPMVQVSLHFSITSVHLMLLLGLQSLVFQAEQTCFSYTLLHPAGQMD